MAIVSEYRNPENKPGPVLRWEHSAASAAPQDAQTQLLYTIAVQAYKIRILLVAALFVVPAFLAVVLVIVLSSL